MLRSYFGDSRRADEGVILTAYKSIDSYLRQPSRLTGEEAHKRRYRIELWSKSFVRALDELEQSLYCSKKYAEGIRQSFVDEMTEQERDDYNRHIYFYKNAFIRLFSILDKLGYFMNELFDLKTERVKARFSYFTVLRLMHQHNREAKLEQQLYDLKMGVKPQLDRLRNQRNMEIHTINADLLDDLLKAMESKQVKDKRELVENFRQNLDDLEQAFEMTCSAVTAVFTYISK